MGWPSTNKDQPYPTNYYQDPNSGFLPQQQPFYEFDSAPNHHNGPTPISAPSCLIVDPTEVPDVPDTCFNYITDLLRDDNPEDQTLATMQDYMAYQAYYQSLDDTLSGSGMPQSQYLSNQLPPLPAPSVQAQEDNFSLFCGSSHGSNSLGGIEDFFVESESNFTHSCQFESSLVNFPLLREALLPSTHPNIPLDSLESLDPVLPTGRKHLHLHVVEEEEEERTNKKNATACSETYEQISEFEGNLFCPEGRYDKPQPADVEGDKLQKSKGKNKNKGVRRRKPEVVDLMSLLTICAESVARMDMDSAREKLKLIRQHSSPYGDSLQRVSHYFANGLEQRLLGGLTIKSQISATEFLKANRIYVGAVPFKIMSLYLANKTMSRLAENARSTSIHIIDFGISYGLQWPCLIYNLSLVKPTPPRFRITGIDFPESGFRPSQRLEETGRCLKRYSDRFNVQFEYKAIVATSWESVNPEEIEIRRDINEITIVNCLYRSHQLYDESVEESSPRDKFLDLVKRMNPDYFVHGVVNGTFNAPFFAMRFKEALNHYTAFFEVFEATMEKEDQERALLEARVFGERVKNVVACEGRERMERPETYRRWQVRQKRAGFKQVELEKELLRRSKGMVKKSFRKDFMLEEDCGWAVQGWKGRILYAISCWKPE